MEAIHEFLSTLYWAKNIPLDVVRRSIENSLCFAVLDGESLAAFARVITDYATFGYLCDVFVIPSYRARGLSKWLLEEIRAYPDLQKLRRWHLLTRDAHELYRKFGFHEPERPERHMELTVKNPYGA